MADKFPTSIQSLELSLCPSTGYKVGFRTAYHFQPKIILYYVVRGAWVEGTGDFRVRVCLVIVERRRKKEIRAILQGSTVWTDAE